MPDDNIARLMLVLRDGNLAITSNWKLYVVNPVTDMEIRHFKSEDYFDKIALLNDGTNLVIGYKKIIIWNMVSGECLRSWDSCEESGAFITCMLFLSDGNLVCGDKNGGVKIWNQNNGELIKSVKSHDKLVSSMAILSDGSLATVSNGSDEIKIFK